MSAWNINIQPLSRRGHCCSEHSLFDFCLDMDANLVGLCGGGGSCGRCIVQIISGKTSDPTDAEKKALTEKDLQDGYRLACQTYPQSDLIVNIPPESLTAPQRLQVDGIISRVEPDPLVKKYDITVEPPSLYDTRADDARVFDALQQQHGVAAMTTDTLLTRTLPRILRGCQWEIRVFVRNGELIHAASQGTSCLGMAVDLGTTKIAGYLMDLETGAILASEGIMNPQIAYGEDVIARIVRAMDAEEAKRLQAVVIDTLNELAVALCKSAGADKTCIVDLVLVGNTAMHHLLLGLPVDILGKAPHIAAVSQALDFKARELGLALSGGAYIHLPPNIAGFVGGDHVAMLLGIDAGNSDETLLAVDIGTNTEISLITKRRISSVSCASGPAFEGYHIKCGMRAAEGAVETIRIKDNDIRYQTIYNRPPVGICGSGILDGAAELYLNHIIDASGRMNANHPRVSSGSDGLEFMLVREGENNAKKAICITQKDLREIQLAKAAIRTGINALLEKHHLQAEDIDRLFIAGAFGNFIDISSAVTIGMLPDIDRDRFKQVGNAAGSGARQALVSVNRRKAALELVQRIEYVELARSKQFNGNFIKTLKLGAQITVHRLGLA
ncbi:MAG: DUF4445 domain-containing protein [Desulfatitalea sp.]|nr:DUF4445 domain-containing protein [Desulfatitalea sp.]NNJ98841.1 DUF4445 domain-containing protein [Desulfatitalea sp.]